MSEEQASNRHVPDKDSISALEARIAFILAREALLHDQPDTAHKAAQARAYQTIRENLEEKLDELRLHRDLLMTRTS